MTQADSVHSTPPLSTTILPAGLAQQQIERERALKKLRRLRDKARDEIDRLLLSLDVSELDPDIEPSLGWTIAAGSYGNDLGIDDLEAEPEHDEDGGDDEPSLGSHELPSGAICYLPSASLGEIDVEEQCEDEGASA